MLKKQNFQFPVDYTSFSALRKRTDRSVRRQCLTIWLGADLSQHELHTQITCCESLTASSHTSIAISAVVNNDTLSQPTSRCQSPQPCLCRDIPTRSEPPQRARHDSVQECAGSRDYKWRRQAERHPRQLHLQIHKAHTTNHWLLLRERSVFSRDAKAVTEQNSICYCSCWAFHSPPPDPPISTPAIWS